MIETVMTFALGFLAASLLALLMFPAINHRADRLARRRAEALFPMSIAELTAEKDHLRAEFAVMQRRLERKVEVAQGVKHDSMEELGRRAMRIESLDGVLAERNQTIDRLAGELADTHEKLATSEGSLGETQAALADRRETLTALETAHRTALDELAAMRRDRDQLQASLSVTASELTRTSHSLAEREDSYARIDAALTAALSEIDAKRIAISDLETRLMTQTARGDDFERALGERHSELSDERKRLAVLAKSLTSEQERGLILEQHIRELETERSAQVSAIAALEAKVEAARTELQEASSRNASSSPEENEELRLRIRELADRIVSPAPGRETKKSAQRPNGRPPRKRNRSA